MRTIITTLFIAFAAFSAQAQPYGSVFGGLTIAPDLDATQSGITLTAEHDVGYNVGGSVGYKFPFGLRVEAEGSYRSNDIDKLSSGGVSVDASGSNSAATFLANLWYDFDTGTKFTPYLGGGIGVAILNTDVELLGVQLVDDDDTVLAWQFGAGAGYEVAPNVSVFADYRFLMTQDPTFTDTTNVDFDAEYMAHNILAGVRMMF